jgi:protein SCO1/2
MFRFAAYRAATLIAVAAALLAATRLSGADQQDVEVVDQDGRTVHFYSGLIKDQVVAINFIFTNCQTICPILGAQFARVDKMLTDHHVSNVLLISVSVDPASDTPGRLRHFAARYGVTQHWKLITGAKGNIEQLLRSLGEYSPDRTAHTGRVLIGRADGGWVRVDGLGSPEKIADLLATAAAQR